MNHTVGILGAGNMGFPISRHLAEDGRTVVVYDILYDATVEKYAGTGITVVRTPKELVERSDVILLIVKDTTITLKNIDREDGLLDGVGGIVVIVIVQADFTDCFDLWVVQERAELIGPSGQGPSCILGMHAGGGVDVRVARGDVDAGLRGF